MTSYPPDAVLIRRSQWGWSAYSGDNIDGRFGENDGLISSSDHIGKLAEYILTLEPSQVIIDPTPYQDSTSYWFTRSKADGCTGTEFSIADDTIRHDNPGPCPVHPGLPEEVTR